MRASLGFVFSIASLTTGILSAAADDSAVAARRVRAHTTFLADDLLEGRGTGSRGYDLAARYVATQFARLGLKPGADGGSYLQTIRLVEFTNPREKSGLVVRHGNQEDALTPVTDMFTVAAPGQAHISLTAPAVFVGFGVQAPDLGYDDFEGIDLTGKIAVVLSGAPANFPSAQRAHHTHRDQKQSLAVRHGAIGMITVMTPRDEARRPWAIAAAQGRFPTMRLVDATGAVVDGYPELQVLATVSRAAAGRLFVAASRPVEEAYARAERHEPQSFPLNVSVTLTAEATTRPVESANVLGWLPGSDPALAGEPVVVTAHLDHLGIGAPVNGDVIYNGAVDNALGIGLFLAAAEELVAAPRRRPVLFAAVTAEEKGLLGSRHLARYPPARVRRYAANVNIDMPQFVAAARDVIGFGAENSTLGAILQSVAGRHGFSISPNPAPDEVSFVRSDQYSFVREGVPALYVDTGVIARDDPTVDLMAADGLFRKERYHRPSDDLTQPINWSAAGNYARLMTDLIGEIADDPQAPAWQPGDFFGETFGRHR